MELISSSHFTNLFPLYGRTTLIGSTYLMVFFEQTAAPMSIRWNGSNIQGDCGKMTSRRNKIPWNSLTGRSNTKGNHHKRQFYQLATKWNEIIE